MKNILMFIMAGAIFASGCKKKESTAPSGGSTSNKTKMELMTDHTWKMTAFTVNPAIDFFGTPISDLYALIDACSKDDFTKFNTDGSAINDEGPTKCDPGDPQTESSTWSFKNNETVISWDGIDYNIVTLNENTLQVNNTEVDQGTTYTYTITMSK